MSEKKFTPLSTEYDQTHTYFQEEFPEGAYGSSIDLPIEKKDRKEEMYPAPRFSYEARGFHEGIPRKDPGAHPTHDDRTTSSEGPYGPGVGSDLQ